MTEVENWRFAIMNNALVPQVGSVEMTALLENTAVRPEGGTLLLPRPSFMWLEAVSEPVCCRAATALVPVGQSSEWLPAPAWTIQERAGRPSACR